MVPTLEKNSALYRRAAFLLNEAQHKARRDQVITFTMRVLSNYATVGKDGGSSKMKDENVRLSSGAYDLMGKVSSIGDWHKLTVNEHPRPLKDIWSWILAEADEISPFDVWNCFVDHPMITLTKTEDSLLSKSGLRATAAPDRYSSLGIETIEVDEPPRDIIRARLQV
ncbi:hypothetical protein [Ruegeria jejuensis]|uniref:hypothetical protein n=1 Tax=Ruegeria jejuensis TaxID=3233338 RepID=UPI00355B09B4